MTDSGEWPQVVRVGGREYELHPDMSITEFTEVAQSIENEVEPFVELADALGMDVSNGDDDGPMGFDGGP